MVVAQVVEAARITVALVCIPPQYTSIHFKILNLSASIPPTEQFSSISLYPPPGTLAVDDSLLQMNCPPLPPQPNPQPSNKVDPSDFQKIIDGLRGSGSEAELPLRTALAKSNTTVCTNHFAIKLDPKMPLYEYKISGLPPKIAKRTSRILVQDAIDKTSFLKDNQNNFVTDYSRLIS